LDTKKPEAPKQLPPLSDEEKAALEELKRIVEGKPKPATVVPFNVTFGGRLS
jgi:hypothetical protein